MVGTKTTLLRACRFHLLEAGPAGRAGPSAILLGGYLAREDARKGEHLERAIELFDRVGDKALLAASMDSTVGLWDVGGDNSHLRANVPSPVIR